MSNKDLLFFLEQNLDHPEVQEFLNRRKQHEPQELDDRLSRVIGHLIDATKTLNRMEQAIMSALDNLTAAVARIGNDVRQIGTALSNHPATATDAQLQSLADQVNASADALESVAATDANTGTVSGTADAGTIASTGTVSS